MGDDDDGLFDIPTSVLLLGGLSGFSLLIAAYLASQAFPASSACSAGDPAQCERYASTVRQLEAFGGAGLIFGLSAYVAWRLSRRT
jgi:hypothetical protein